MTEVKLRIGKSTDLKAEMINVLHDQLSFIMQTCDQMHEAEGGSVHLIRRSFKKSRAVLRLIRDSIGYSAYFRENRNLRDMHRLLSGAREANVFIQTLDTVVEIQPSFQDRDWFKKAKKESVIHHERELELLLSQDIPGIIQENVRLTYDRIPGYHFRGAGFEIIRPGLMRIYRQGRKQKACFFEPEVSAWALHEFRKKAKYLYYQLELLRPSFPRMLKATSKILDEITELLGNYNDYYEAKEKLEALIPHTRSAQNEAEAFYELLDSRQTEIISKTKQLTEQLYAETPEAFTSRLQVYWESWAERNQGMR